MEIVQVLYDDAFRLAANHAFTWVARFTDAEEFIEVRPDTRPNLGNQVIVNVPAMNNTGSISQQLATLLEDSLNAVKVPSEVRVEMRFTVRPRHLGFNLPQDRVLAVSEVRTRTNPFRWESGTGLFQLFRGAQAVYTIPLPNVDDFRRRNTRSSALREHLLDIVGSHEFPQVVDATTAFFDRPGGAGEP